MPFWNDIVVENLLRKSSRRDLMVRRQDSSRAANRHPTENSQHLENYDLNVVPKLTCQAIDGRRIRSISRSIKPSSLLK